MNNKEITLEKLIEAKKTFSHSYPKLITTFRCGPVFYQRLDRYLTNLEVERILNGIKEPEHTPIDDFCSIRIFVDKSIPPDDWRFE